MDEVEVKLEVVHVSEAIGSSFEDLNLHNNPVH